MNSSDQLGEDRVGWPAQRAQETRRSLLGKAALVTGAGLGFAAIADPPAALAAEPQGYVNVRDHGATGDGTTDDRAAIQTAIDAAETAGGGVVWFPPGTYNVGDRLDAKSGVWLRGAGSKSVIKAQGGGSPSPRHVIFGQGVDDVTISDLVIDGNRGERSGRPGNIRFSGASDTSIAKNIHVHRCENRESPGIANVFLNVAHSSVTQCWIHGTGGPGISASGIDTFYNCENILYQGNVVEGTSDDAIALNAEALNSDGTRHGGTHLLRRVLITGNVIAGGAEANDCVNIRAAKDVVISGNVMFQGQAAGVTVANLFDTPAEDVIISDNVLVEGGVGSSSGTAIAVVGAEQGTVADDFGTAGCNRITIKGNIIRNPRFAGVWLSALPANAGPGPRLPGDLNDVQVVDNKIYFDPPGTSGGPTIENAARGILSTGTAAAVNNLAIEGNVVRNSRAHGVYAATNHNDLAVTNNRVLDSGYPGQSSPGIRIASAKNVQIVGNHATDTRSGGARTQSRGLELADLTGGVVVASNDLLGNSVSAVLWTNAQNASEVAIAGNVGYRPWRGRINAPGAWTAQDINGSRFYRKILTVTFPLPFPTGSLPKVVVTLFNHQPYWANVVNVSNTNFVVRIWSSGANDPGTAASPDVQWAADQ